MLQGKTRLDELEHVESTAPRDDPVLRQARDVVEDHFNANPEKVFFSRQLELLFEDRFFHWVTNRAIHEVIASGLILMEERALATGTTIKLLWHRTYRYYRREAAAVVRLVEEYSHPNIGGELGDHAEMMVLEGFARCQFVMRGRSINEFGGKKWEKTNHNLDFVFERDGRAYGVEVKNMLGYMDQDEFRLKIDICRELGVAPVFAVRMLPKTWIAELTELEDLR